MNGAENVIAFPGGDEVAADDLVLVAPGDYSALYVRHAGTLIFRTPKVRVDFRLLDYPQPVVLSRWYRVSDFRRGRIRAGRSSAIVREISAALDRRVRCDRIPVAALEGHEVVVRVRTVTADGAQTPLAEVNQYSVIERLL